MCTVAVISYEEKVRKGRVWTERIWDNDVVRIKLKKGSRRLLKKAIEKYNIERAVVEGKIPEFAENILSKSDIKIYSGRDFVRKLLPTLVARASKYDGGVDRCTVYDKCADEETAKVIKEVSKKFKYVSLYSESEDTESIAEYIMDETGLALSFGEYENGVAVVCSGCGGKQQIKIDLVNYCGIVLMDGKNRKVSVALAEAISGDRGDFSGLKLKLYKTEQ